MSFRMHPHCCLWITVAAWLGAPPALMAASEPGQESQPQESRSLETPPPMADEGEVPERVQGEVPDSEVTIIRRDRATIKEYRANGQVYMVEIIPDKGASYYIVDTDGDGRLDTRRGTLQEGMDVPQWILFRW